MLLTNRLKILPKDMDIEVLYDLDKAIESASTDGSCICLSMEVIMERWFELIVAQAIKSDSIAESDILIENYMENVPECMEESILEVCDLADLCVVIDGEYVINGPQMSLFRKGQAVSELGGYLWAFR